MRPFSIRTVASSMLVSCSKFLTFERHLSDTLSNWWFKSRFQPIRHDVRMNFGSRAKSKWSACRFGHCLEEFLTVFLLPIFSSLIFLSTSHLFLTSKQRLFEAIKCSLCSNLWTLNVQRVVQMSEVEIACADKTFRTVQKSASSCQSNTNFRF